MYAKYMMQTKDFFSEQTSSSVLEQKKYNDKDNENGNRKKNILQSGKNIHIIIFRLIISVSGDYANHKTKKNHKSEGTWRNS
jgi:hypothetical protein